MMGSHSLLFDGTLELCDPDGSISGGGYWFETLASGLSFGDPQPIEVAIGSLLRDGAITEKQGDGNREQSFLVKVRASDSQGIADGVAALTAATGKRTTLAWTPPDGYGPTTVFDVLTSNLASPGDFDDLAWMRNEMVYKLRLVCLPYGRSVAKIIDDAGTPPSSGGTLLYNCESDAGWSKWSTFSGSGGSSVGTTISVDTTIYTEGAGSLRSTSEYSYNADGTAPVYFYSSDQVTGLSLSTGSGGYLSIAIRTAFVADLSHILDELWMSTASDEQAVTNFVAVRVDENGFTHYVWPVDSGLTITGLRFRVYQNSGSFSPTGKAYVWYDDVELLPSATTDHQIVKQLEVQGSARTTGSLHIAAPSDVVALGQVLAVTAPTGELPAGFTPDGERWVAQGDTTPDISSMTGHYYTPETTTYSSGTGDPIFEPPVTLLTAGPYMIVGLVKAESASLTFGVQAQLRIGSNGVGPTSAAESSPKGLTTGWQFVVVGTVYLPPLPMQGPDTDAKVRLLFKGAKFANVYFIPAWQVGGRPVADFSIVDCGTETVEPGGASSSLWIDSPSVVQPQGGWWRGPTTDRLNAQSAWPDAKKPGVHVFKPGPLTAFLVSTGAQGPTMALEYPPAWVGSAAS